MERETGSDMTISRLECPVVIEFHEMECVMLAPITATFSPSLSLSFFLFDPTVLSDDFFTHYSTSSHRVNL